MHIRHASHRASCFADNKSHTLPAPHGAPKWTCSEAPSYAEPVIAGIALPRVKAQRCHWYPALVQLLTDTLQSTHTHTHTPHTRTPPRPHPFQPCSTSASPPLHNVHPMVALTLQRQLPPRRLLNPTMAPVDQQSHAGCGLPVALPPSAPRHC